MEEQGGPVQLLEQQVHSIRQRKLRDINQLGQPELGVLQQLFERHADAAGKLTKERVHVHCVCAGLIRKTVC